MDSGLALRAPTMRNCASENDGEESGRRFKSASGIVADRKREVPKPPGGSLIDGRAGCIAVRSLIYLKACPDGRVCAVGRRIDLTVKGGVPCSDC